MKTLIKLFLLMLLTVSYTSCDAIDELTEVDFDTTLNETLNVNIPVGENLTLENNTMSINIVNSDTEDYLDVFQNVKITSFTYQLINFSGDIEGVIDGRFEADGVQLVNHNMIVKQTVDAGTVFEVTNVSHLNTIASNLKAGKDVVVGVFGESTCTEAMNFTIAISIDLAITADVL